MSKLYIYKLILQFPQPCCLYCNIIVLRLEELLLRHSPLAPLASISA